MEKTIALAILLLSVIAGTESVFTHNCMTCIREKERGPVGSCNMDTGSMSCGPYQIKQAYYSDCGKPGTDWKTCTTQLACSETCVKAYMARWGKRCPAPVTCEDYARLHNGGYDGCNQKSKKLDDYWRDVKMCCDRKGGC